MTVKYVVFWLDTERKLYNGDDSYWVLGELMSSFDTEQEAIEYIGKLNLRPEVKCTILKTYSGTK
jgi:hypothetical protein